MAMNQKDEILKLVYENNGKIQTKLVVEQNGQMMIDNKRKYGKFPIIGIVVLLLLILSSGCRSPRGNHEKRNDPICHQSYSKYEDEIDIIKHVLDAWVIFYSLAGDLKTPMTQLYMGVALFLKI